MASTAPEGKGGVPVSVIAGGAGFLGSHLVEILIAQGQEVYCLDTLTTGKEEYLAGVLKNPRFHFKVGDINQGLPNLPKVNYVYHLAGVEEYINGTDVSVETLLVNSIGTKNLLDLASQHKAKILLASSVDIYSGILSSLTLHNYFGISHRDEERFSHHEAKRYAEALTTEYFKKFGVDARIIRLANVYGPRMDLRSGTEMAELLSEALQPEGESLTIHGDGLKVIYPTYVSDIVFGFVKTMTDPESTGKIFNLVNPEPQTVLSFANRLRQVAPTHPKLVFTGEVAETKFAVRPVDLEMSQKELGWRAAVGLEDGLKRTLAYFRKEGTTPAIPQVTLGTAVEAVTQPVVAAQEFSRRLQPFSAASRLKEFANFLWQGMRRPRKHVSSAATISTRRLRLKAATATFLVFIFISVLVPIGGVVFQSGYGTWRLRSSQSAILAGQADSALAAASDASAAFAGGEDSLQDLSWLLTLLGLSGVQTSYQNLLGAAEELSIAAREFSQALKPMLKVGQELVATDVTIKLSADQTVKELSGVSSTLTLADDHLAAAEGKITQVEVGNLPWFVSGQLSTLSARIKETRTAVTRAQAAIKILPEVIGLNGTRNYLLLFMNNTELRPGGGFIGSYGIAKFEDGRLRDLFIDDIYNADGQLTERISPPQPLKDYLGVGNLTLRDSNFSPDFPASSKLARELLFKEVKREVFGVIALDIQTIEKLLLVTGPVTVSDFGETVTSENFYERAQYHAEIGFFPGSSAKKDFIGAVGRIVLDRILRSKPETWPVLAQAIQSALDEKHMLFNFDDHATQELVAESGWDGAVKPTANSQTNRLEDYLMVVDANLGANKANYFIKNQANYRVAADKNGQLQATLTILYEHTATTETWPSGRYKDYLRVYVPKGASLQRFEMSDVKEAPAVTTSTEFDKTVFSLFFEIPSQTKKTLIFTYLIPSKLPTIASPTDYHLMVQKQAGTELAPFSINFDVPTFLRVTSAEGTNVNSYSVRINSDLKTDREFNLTVSP